MCAASPARNRRPCCIVSDTKLRIGVTLFCVIRPSVGVQPVSFEKRVCSSSQIRASDHSARSSSGLHCRYRRVTVGERIENNAKPLS